MSIYLIIFCLNNLQISSKTLKKTSLKSTPYKVKRPKNFLISFKKLNKPYMEKGLCSYYNSIFHGRYTSTGDVFSNKKWTCAHKTLPLPSVILVTYINNKQIKGVKLLVNDRGPFIKNRILDVSQEVAKEIGVIKIGIKKVVIFFLEKESLHLLKTGVFLPIKKSLNIGEINLILKKNNIVLV